VSLQRQMMTTKRLMAMAPPVFRGDELLSYRLGEVLLNGGKVECESGACCCAVLCESLWNCFQKFGNFAILGTLQFVHF